eukprot:m.84242 g.84242  ORF g.84242 m.84242 type:complete len:170 (-) comp12742_c0_seq2:1987-2496(-)
MTLNLSFIFHKVTPFSLMSTHRHNSQSLALPEDGEVGPAALTVAGSIPASFDPFLLLNLLLNLFRARGEVPFDFGERRAPRADDDDDDGLFDPPVTVDWADLGEDADVAAGSEPPNIVATSVFVAAAIMSVTSAGSVSRFFSRRSDTSYSIRPAKWVIAKRVCALGTGS